VCGIRAQFATGCGDRSKRIFTQDPGGGPESRFCYTRLGRSRRARAGARTASAGDPVGGTGISDVGLSVYEEV
jgi:hypothetical protein